MSAAKYDLNVSCGEDHNFTLRVLNAYDDPFNFDGSTFKAEIREEHKKPLVAAFAITNVGDGTIKLALTNEQTKIISPTRNYKWDLFWTQSGGNIIKLLYGTVKSISNISNV